MDITGGACRVTAHVSAQDCIQSLTCVESFGQGLKYRPTLVNGETDGQHPLSGLVEQLPDNHPGVASGCGCIGTAYDNVAASPVLQTAHGPAQTSRPSCSRSLSGTS